MAPISASFVNDTVEPASTTSAVTASVADVSNTTLAFTTNSSSVAAQNATTTTPPNVTQYNPWQNQPTWPTVAAPPVVGYYYYWDYSFYILLVFVFLLCVPLIFIKMAMRKRQQTTRAAVLQLQARRQVEINIANAANNGNGSDNVACPANLATDNVTLQNDISVLPKDDDLPPAYDEVIINYPNSKEQLQAADNLGSNATLAGAVSTMTIATELEASCNNLALTESSATAEHSI